MGIFDWKHWIVILIVVVLVFGTKRLKNLGSDVGEAIKGFRKAVNTEEDDKKDQPAAQPAQPLNQPHTIDAQAQKVEAGAQGLTGSHRCSESASANCCWSGWSPCWCSAPSVCRAPHVPPACGSAA